MQVTGVYIRCKRETILFSPIYSFRSFISLISLGNCFPFYDLIAPLGVLFRLRAIISKHLGESSNNTVQFALTIAQKMLKIAFFLHAVCNFCT